MKFNRFRTKKKSNFQDRNGVTSLAYCYFFFFLVFQDKKSSSNNPDLSVIALDYSLLLRIIPDFPVIAPHYPDIGPVKKKSRENPRKNAIKLTIK